MDSLKKPRKNRSHVWDHYDVISGSNDVKLAKCKYCIRIMNASSTITNLQKHTSKQHPSEYCKPVTEPNKNYELNDSTAQNVEKNESADEEKDDKIDKASVSDSDYYPETKDELLRRRKRIKKVWEYYDDVGEPGDKTARCQLCSETLAYRSTTANLRLHLQRKHKLVFEHDTENDYDTPAQNEESSDGNASDKSEYRPKRKTGGGWNKNMNVWKHYEVTSYSRKIARCKLCLQTISFKSTTTNLRIHLQRKHKDVSVWADNTAANAEMDFTFADDNTNDDATGDYDDVPVTTNPLEDGQPSSEVMQFYHQDSTKGLYTCILCAKPVFNANDMLRTHLSEEHQDLVVLDGEAEIDTGDALLKEFIKIESKKKRKLPLKDQLTPEFKPAPSKIIKVVETKQPMSEIDCFFQYIGVLMKDIPKESLTKLQLAIINLIMTKKIECENDVSINQSSVLAGNGETVEVLAKP